MTIAGTPGSADPAPDAQALLHAIDEDPARLAALRAAYHGRHDVRDALWWRVHPTVDSPRGAIDPVVERNRLALHAFSRAAVPSTEIELRDLERKLLRDAHDLDAAIDADRARIPLGTAPASTTPSRPEGSIPERQRILRRVLASRVPIVAVAVVATVIVGGWVAWARLSPSGDSALSSGSGKLPPVFSRPQQAADDPAVRLPREYDRDTVRRISPVGADDRSDDYLLFAARSINEDLCLVLVFPDDRIASSCVSPLEFAANGIRVSANVFRQSTASLGSSVMVAHTVHWRPDGTIWYSSGSANEGP